jgi:hypothetical protein
LIQGNLNAGELDVNCYSGVLSIAPLFERFASPGPLSGAEGVLTGVDIDFTGELLKPAVSGEITIERFTLKDFSLENIRTRLDVKVLESAGDFRLGGKAVCEGGTLSGKNTALIRLEKATFAFHGPPANPAFDIAAGAEVRGTKIRLVVTGTPERPELRLSSKPAKSRETLLLMLATNREWTGVEKTLEGEAVPAEVASDLIGYLVWGRVEETLARTLKLDRVALEVQEEKKGISISKRVNESTRVDVNAAREGETVKSKVGVTVKLTPDFAVEAEKNLQREDGAGGEPEGDKVMLKFKKDF